MEWIMKIGEMLVSCRVWYCDNIDETRVVTGNLKLLEDRICQH